MATSGTYAKVFTAGDLAMQAFVRAGVARTDVTAQHIADAQTEANLMMASLSNDIPHLWTSETYTATSVDGQASYTLPERIIDIQVAYIRTTSGSVTTDRVIGPMSTAEYAGLSNKSTEGAPTAYWLDKQITPVLYLWPVPDAATYTIALRCLSRFQDTLLANGTEAEIPYRFYDAFCWGLAYRLAAIYKPEKAQALGQIAQAELAKAKAQDTDHVPVRVSLGSMAGYWR
jgi:hypothetical protein